MIDQSAIRSAQLRQMLSISNVSLATSATMALILAIAMNGVVAGERLVLWCAMMVLSVLLRAALMLVYQLYPANDQISSVRLVRYRIVIMVAGMAWGSAGFLLYPEQYPQYQMYLIFVLMGMTAGGLISFSSDLLSATVFSVAMVVPIMLRLLVTGDGLYVTMGVASFLYLCFMIMSSRSINRSLTENIALRLGATMREDAVRESEERYRSLLNHSPVGIFHYDTALRLTYCNNRLADIMHTPVEKLTGADMSKIKDTSILPAMRAALGGETGYYEGYYSATYGNIDGWIDLTCAPCRDGKGNIVGGIAIVQDISRRKQAETDLRIAATVFESQEGMMVTDAENRILRVNYAFTDITGYTPEEVVGKTPHVLRSGRHDAAFYSAMWKTISQTGSWEGELWNKRKNGEIYPEKIGITAVKDLAGNITNYVATFYDISESKAAADEIRHLAYYDALTRLPNRRMLMDRLRQSLASSAHCGHRGALLFIDLDNFKVLNDTMGHDVGDMLLQQVSQRLLASVREEDTVARLGGDEFVVMLEELSKNPTEAATQAEIVGNKILAAFNQPYMLGAQEYRSTSSIGVSIFSGHQSSVDELLKQADIAMYQSKKSGRNTLRFFDPKMQETINERAALESELHKALENRQFQLYYQVQVDDSGRALGAEALIRWIHPERGLVQPAQIIPVAEETGLIVPIGLWVLQTACAQLKTWERHEHTRELVLAVNVSAGQFRQPDFVAQLRSVVQDQGINARRLKLELTESLLLDNVEEVIATMEALKEIGVQFSLDDFGTGYSSLQYLKRLPFDQVKIEQSFVRDMATNGNDSAIVGTIIAMAASLEMGVIAEGVETEEQRQLLWNKGCTQYQGYLFGMPVPVAQFEESLLHLRAGLVSA